MPCSEVAVAIRPGWQWKLYDGLLVALFLFFLVGVAARSIIVVHS